MLRIIYVDDDYDECFLFAEALQRLGIKHKLYIAGKCSELIRILEENNNIDIIFLDMHMPLTDGRECLKIVKENADWKSIPVIILTGHYNKFDTEEVYALGAHLYVIKPIVHKDFVSMLQKILSFDWLNKPAPAFGKFVIKDREQIQS